MEADYDRYLDWQRKECEEEPLVEMKSMAKVKVKVKPSEPIELKKENSNEEKDKERDSEEHFAI